MGPQQSQHEQRSILDDLGEEVTGIITPVSICMAFTVALVKTLNPAGASDARSVFIASAFYTEKDTDSSSTKTFGALVNASIFVVIVTMMTFLLVFLFKRGYTRLIYSYMCFAGFSIFFVLAGILLLQLLEKFNIAIDAISYLFILYNFAMVGVLGLFVWPAPMTLKQVYLTITGVIVAFVFTWAPEWTTWTLLIAMAIYDMFAVLMPGGPLKELVHIAEERQVDIPALVYEARPVSRDTAEHLHDVASDSAWAHTTRPRRMHDVATGATRPYMPASSHGRQQTGSGCAEDGQSPHAEVLHMEAAVIGGRQMPSQHPEDAPLVESGHGMQQPNGQHSSQAAQQQQSHEQRQGGSDDGNSYTVLLPDAIKLGLGDFIFYSVLVGRAAMHDMLTAYMAYLAIVAGLGATLLLLAMCQKVLPALPVSISLGVAFYFAARLLLEPFALSLSTNLVFF